MCYPPDPFGAKSWKHRTLCVVLALFVTGNVLAASMSSCTALRAGDPPSVTQTLLLRTAVRLGTQGLLTWHPELAPDILAWADLLHATEAPTAWTLDALGPALLASLETHTWPPGARLMMAEGLEVILVMAHVALDQEAPRVGGLLLTVRQVGVWMAEVARAR